MLSVSDLPTLNAILSAFGHPPASADPIDIGDLVFQATSNTTLTLKYRGDDDVVRSVALTLS